MTIKLEQARVKLTKVRESVAKYRIASAWAATELTLDEVEALLAAERAEGMRCGVRDAQRAIANATTYTKAVCAVDDLRIDLEKASQS